MLLELYGQNFGCFRDEFRLSMLATDIDPGDDRGIVEVQVEGDDEPLRLLRAVAIYGPNASGKSTVLAATNILGQLIGYAGRSKSRDSLPGYLPFVFTSSNEPVRLGLVAVIDQQIYDYEIRFDRNRVHSERLQKSQFDENQILLDRQYQQATGLWMENKRFALLAAEFNENALLLSLADRIAPSLAKNIASGLAGTLISFGNIDVPYMYSEIAEQAHRDERFKSWLITQLKAADVGVEGIQIDEVKSSAVPFADSVEEQDLEDDEVSFRMTLLHQGAMGKTMIPFYHESGGTRRLINLSPTLFGLSSGQASGTFFIDEIDRGLHPTLLQGIIKHFNCDIPMKEVRGQLVFVTHETALLDAEAKNAILRRDQIYLTEKDSSGAARLYSVAEFKERNNLNLRKRYLQGRYGALPSLGTFKD